MACEQGSVPGWSGAVLTELHIENLGVIETVDLCPWQRV